MASEHKLKNLKYNQEVFQGFKVDKFKKPGWSPSPNKIQCILSPKDSEQWSPFKNNSGTIYIVIIYFNI